MQDQFDDYRESTIGAAFLTQTIALDENTTVKFEIWDTAGQERYKSLAPMYYRNANCAVVVYDITQAVRPYPSPSTFPRLTPPGLPRQSKSLGQRTPTPSQRKHYHRPRRQQTRSRDRIPRQARHLHRRRRAIRPRSRPPLLRDVGQDKREREGALHGYREETAHRPGGTQEPETGPATTGR